MDALLLNGVNVTVAGCIIASFAACWAVAAIGDAMRFFAGQYEGKSGDPGI
jgi:hypothetical protein